jgi:hypothetical protein
VAVAAALVIVCMVDLGELEVGVVVRLVHLITQGVLDIPTEVMDWLVVLDVGHKFAAVMVEHTLVEVVEVVVTITQQIKVEMVAKEL